MKKIVWIAAFAAGAALMTPFSTLAEELIPDGVYIGGMDLAGLTEAEAEKKISEYAETKENQNFTLTVGENSIDVTGEDVGLSWTNKQTVDEALESTRLSGNLINRYMKSQDILQSPVDVAVELAVDQEKMEALIRENYGDYVDAPKDATIKRENGEFVITPSSNGTEVDIAATENALNEAFNGDDSGNIAVEAVIAVKEPRIKTEDLETIQDVLGTYSTDFKTSGAARSTNLAVGASKINGSVLMPGDVLSGYDCMNPFTEANGYKTATAYENGRSVDSVGGGVCQIATTLYNASLYAELDIVQRQNHSMTVGYVKPSLDAAIAGTYKDIKVSNPYDTPIYIEGYTSGKTLTFTIYGKETRPSNRTLAFESETLQTIDAGEPIEQVDNSLAPGERVKVESGHTGIKSRMYKCVYVDGALTERTLMNSDTYNASRAIYRVGPALPEGVITEQPEAAENTAPTEAAPAPAPEETVPATEAAPEVPQETKNPDEVGPGFP